MNQLFAGLYDLILCRMTKMNFLAPATPGRTLQEIFQAKIPKIDPQDATEREKFIIGPELIAYLKWLIYTAAFKDPSAGERGVPNIKFFTDWVQEIFSKEQGYRKLLLEELKIWYTKHLPAKKRGRDSIEQDLPRRDRTKISRANGMFFPTCSTFSRQCPLFPDKGNYFPTKATLSRQ
jgi:hypothetical protein